MIINKILTVCKKTTLVILPLIISMIIGCSGRPYVQKPESMMPSIQPNEKVYVDEKAYSEEIPKRWDVVVFNPLPPDEGVWIFRVVGLPGETISFDKRGLMINGKHIEKPIALSKVQYMGPNANQQSSLEFPFSIPEESYFVLGDNPPVANDSRMWGSIRRDQIIGKVLHK